MKSARHTSGYLSCSWPRSKTKIGRKPTADMSPSIGRCGRHDRGRVTFETYGRRPAPRHRSSSVSGRLDGA